MPGKRGYRGRAVRRVRQQGNRKVHNPTVKFILNKSYVVNSVPGVQTMPTAMLTINAATPFNPISVHNGNWTANDNNSEPMGLASDLYSNYQHLVVKGCHITASVTDEPDQVAGSQETITKGTIAIARHTGPNTLYAATFDNNALKTMYGAKSRNFQLSPRGTGTGTANNILTKNAKVSNGYSAKKTWNSNANANDDLRVVNSSGSSAVPIDSTYLSIGVMPQRVWSASTNTFLQPVAVNVRIVYIIQFQEPTIRQTVPLPMGAARSLGTPKSNGKGSGYYEYLKSVVDNPYFKQLSDHLAATGVRLGARYANNMFNNNPNLLRFGQDVN
ncbi:MAG: hypothetical protein [Circular genetic element sp.]|nr:MAG: hypothetical protein [Circular genetic element sp.]